MPVRSLNSSVIIWPQREEVEREAKVWAANLALPHADVVAVSYFGSYATGNDGVGSDLDLVVLVSRGDLSAKRRAASWERETLPVPSDLLVYTQDEWAMLAAKNNRFSQMLANDVVWVWRRKK